MPPRHVYLLLHDPPATRGVRGVLAGVVLALLPAASARAQGTPGFGLDPAKPLAQYSRDVWQVDDGLPQNSVNAMVQTRDGYLWLGTRGGLATFDGVRFHVFDRPSFSQLRQIHILALFEDSRGNLWIGTSGGGVSRLSGGVFTTFTTADGLTSNVVWAIAEGRDGSILMGTDGGGVTRFKDNRFSPLIATGPLARGFVTTLLEDRHGALWLGTGGHGLTRYLDGKTTTFTAKDGLGDDYIDILLEDHAGAMWIGTSTGLVRYLNGRFTRYTVKDGLSNDNVWSLCEDSRQTLWIGTYGGGLNRLVDGRFSALTTKNGLSNDIVMSILEDREGSLWVGTSGGGVDRLQDGIFTTYGQDIGIGAQPVTGVAEDRSGAIWTGTDGDGLFRFADGRITRFTRKDGLADEEVSSIAEDADGTLWVGTDGSGISRYANGRFTTLAAKDGLPSEFIDTIVPARGGGVWIGTDGRGLARYAHGTFTVRDTSNGLSNDFVRAVLETKSGELWVGTYGGGVTRIAGGHTSTIAQKDGLSSDFVTALYEDADGAVWVGTYGGGLTRVGVTALVGLAGWSRRRAGARREELEWLVDRRTAQLRQEIADRERAEEERLRLESQIQHAQKLESLAVLAGGIAHDFNNLLSAILGNAELAQLHLPPDSEAREAREAFEQIEIAAITAAELTSQMLAYSGQGRLVIGAISLKQIVEDMAQLLRAILSRSVEIRYEHAAALPPIRGDATQLRQIVMNLMLNASEAIGDAAGVVTLRTGARTIGGREVPLPEAGWLNAGGYVFLEVSDTGSGMDDATVAKIFDPFFTTKFTGRGLGLAAAQGIMRSHHGAIIVDTAPGRGTTFTLLFPPCGAGADAADDSESPDPPREAPVRS